LRRKIGRGGAREERLEQAELEEESAEIQKMAEQHHTIARLIIGSRVLGSIRPHPKRI